MLPPELHSPILRHVLSRYDKQLWLACALTCREWLSIVAPYLFRTIIIQEPGGIKQVLTAQVGYQSSLLSLYTRGAILRVTPSKRIVGPIVYLHLLFQSFPNLESLRIDLDHDGYEKTPRLSVIDKGSYKEYSHFTALSTLFLCRHYFHSFIDVIRICGSLHALQELHLQNVSWEHTPQTIPPLHQLHHRLRVATCQGCTASIPLLWLWACYSRGGSRGPDLARDDIMIISKLMETLYAPKPETKVAVQGWDAFDDPLCSGESYLS